MTTNDASRSVSLLGPEVGSLARGIPPAPLGTLFVLGEHGGVRARPDSAFTVVFGRNLPDVHVCVGENDPRVSRRHGTISRRNGGWFVYNTGRIPLRMPGTQLVLPGQEDRLPIAYTPVFIRTAASREHLLEVRIAGPSSVVETAAYDESTRQPQVWHLDEHEHLALVVLGQRYLRHEPRPQPLTWKVAAEELHELQPHARWTAKRVEHVVGGVRGRLAAANVPGLLRSEVGEPVGNSLNHNLLVELMLTATIVPPDLRLLG